MAFDYNLHASGCKKMLTPSCLKVVAIGFDATYICAERRLLLEVE